MRGLFLACALLLLLQNSLGLWYGGPRPENLDYNTPAFQNTYFDNLPFATLSLKINRSIEDGPGQELVTDPLNSGRSLFVGNTINRETFETQFILDLEFSIGISPDRVYLSSIRPGDIIFSDETTSVIVDFIFLERNDTVSITMLEAISNLTVSIQDTNSSVYIGTNVTKYIDSFYGLDVLNWDVSLKLSYAIEVIGGNETIDGYFLNQGSQEICSTPLLYNYPVYCEFERYFVDDLSNALNISYSRIQVLFVKKAALDAVLIYFRIYPPIDPATETNTTLTIGNLILEVMDPTSALYQGNVTLHVDPTWGVSNSYVQPRSGQALFTWKYYEIDDSIVNLTSRARFNTPYDRCKANKRCNWGVIELNQSTNVASFYLRLFDQGKLFSIGLFLDFEDWRTGTKGVQRGLSPLLNSTTAVPSQDYISSYLPGAHFWPFNETSLGPTVPAYLYETNEGLVLDRSMQDRQIDLQIAFIDDISNHLAWLDANIDTINMDATRRSRRDVRLGQTYSVGNISQALTNEIAELVLLNSSQCVLQNCELRFNTSDLTMVGAINGTGSVQMTANGTEVALFSFNSIRLGPEVQVTVVGQRPLVLSSRTSILLNTSISAAPGTLGGFPGGGSVARLANESLIDNPQLVMICDLLNICDFSRTNTNFSASDRASFISNNVNGPGSGNLRVYPFVIQTEADVIYEVQSIQTQARSGQTLAGGFTLSYRSFVTPLIPHDVSSVMLKDIIESNMNTYPVRSSQRVAMLRSEGPVGIGRVEVSRSVADQVGGYEWRITFTSAIGDLPQILATSFLQGLEANISTSTLVNGNEINGTFVLSFNNETSPILLSTETAAGMKTKLLQMPTVSTAFVLRTDPTGLCDDGLCMNGPLNARGYIWTVFLTVDEEYGNATPYSPTSPTAQLNVTAASIFLNTSNLSGTGATAYLSLGFASSSEEILNALSLTFPFSLAYGGAGGSYGGRGGQGYGDNPTGALYGDETISDLFGGSGGSMRAALPFDESTFAGVGTGLGGAGGGALELIAINDITIGSFGSLIARGQDGEESGEGGAGGGSGGAILLSAGGIVVNNGILDVSGGGGGFGGLYPGGGGGGGRIAIYGQSILMSTSQGSESVVSCGGPCGVQTSLVNISTPSLVIDVTLFSVLPLDSQSLSFIAESYLSGRLAGEDYISLNASAVFLNQTFGNTTEYIVNQILTLSSSANLTTVLSQLAEMEVYTMADVTVVGLSLLSVQVVNITTTQTINTVCSNPGSNGTIFLSSQLEQVVFIDSSDGAEGTSKALHIIASDHSPFGNDALSIPFTPSQPSRISYYCKTKSVATATTKADFGSLVTLTSNGAINVVGIYFGESITHGSNFEFIPSDSFRATSLNTLEDYPVLDEWYKFDIHMNWQMGTYYLLLNDVMVAKDQPFQAEFLDALQISTFHATDILLDEIYIGVDPTMSFQCPLSQSVGLKVQGAAQFNWKESQVYGGGNGIEAFNKMTRHYSFYEPSNVVPFDGQGSISFQQDYQFPFSQTSLPQLHSAALLYLTSTGRSQQVIGDSSATTASKLGWWKKTNVMDPAGDGRYFWYIEMDYNSSLSSTQNGGICACSSQDLKRWRFEGIIFQYTNLTDMVFGSPGPFHMEKPKVLQNNVTGNFVLWAVMDNMNRSLGAAVVLTSPYEDGPFYFRRSLYPDGNMTHDQTTNVNVNSSGTLSRTYYQTIDYVLPEPMMQPVWESVKHPNGETFYRNSYQRAHYNVDYDNYHDIYLQRWRKENKPWEVLCINKISKAERSVPIGSDVFCTEPDEYKVVIGQGDPYVHSNFIDPQDPKNSWWQQSSVPAVQAQPWNNSVQDGLCGLEQADAGLTNEDPNLVNFIPQNRSSCSNIADNPIQSAVPDKLIGIQRVLSRRRAKFVAVSGLTYDFMDTTGKLTSLEGELQSNDLISLMNNDDDHFGFSPGNTIQSTFHAPLLSPELHTASDFKTRFRQYIFNYNDRAYYSLACIIDGVCPVNFRDEITVGQV